MRWLRAIETRLSRLFGSTAGMETHHYTKIVIDGGVVYCGPTKDIPPELQEQVDEILDDANRMIREAELMLDEFQRKG